MQFYFIRHGQSENNLLWANTGSSQGRSTDPELTPVGQQQAERVARFVSQRAPDFESGAHNSDVLNVAGFGITHLYCSLMIRAVATGTAIAQALSLPLVGWKDLHETGGIFRYDAETGAHIGLPGNNRAFFEDRYPDLILPDWLGKQGWWNRPFEEPEERPERARRFLVELLEKHGQTDDRVAVVSHGGFFVHLMRAIWGLPADGSYWLYMNNTALTRIDLDPKRVSLCYLNRADFLPRDLIT